MGRDVPDEGGDYDVDPSFEDGPKAFLAHARKVWARTEDDVEQCPRPAGTTTTRAATTRAATTPAATRHRAATRASSGATAVRAGRGVDRRVDGDRGPGRGRLRQEGARGRRGWLGAGGAAAHSARRRGPTGRPRARPRGRRDAGSEGPGGTRARLRRRHRSTRGGRRRDSPSRRVAPGDLPAGVTATAHLDAAWRFADAGRRQLRPVLVEGPVDRPGARTPTTSRPGARRSTSTTGGSRRAGRRPACAWSAITSRTARST